MGCPRLMQSLGVTACPRLMQSLGVTEQPLARWKPVHKKRCMHGAFQLSQGVLDS